MKALLQRVLKAEVASEGAETKSIDYGMVIFLGIAESDTGGIADRLLRKVLNIRMFDGNKSKFDKSIIDVEGEILVISQFTLFADTSHGRRPTFFKAAKPDKARLLFEYFCFKLEEASANSVRKGEFGSRMIVDAKNLGPFSIMIDEN